MSSILTNTSAMVALQTLNTINDSLNKTQSEISTGKSIESAKDNAAIWAISKTMESDVAGFNAISDSLALGESTITVARAASETVTDLLTQIKGKVVAAQEQNVDRAKIQTDIEALTGQVTSIVEAAQFNGLNLLKGTEDVNILSSLDRQSNGVVNASNITVNRQDLSTSAGVNGVGSGGTDLSGQILDAVGGSAYSGGTLSATGSSAIIEFAGDWDTADSTSLTIGGQTVSYTATADDETPTNARDALLSSLQALDLSDITFTATSTDQITATSTRSFDDLAISMDDSGVSGGAGNSYIETINGTATGNTTTESGTIDQRAEEVFFSTAAAPAEGNSYQASVGGAAYFYTAGKGENFEDVARGLKTAIDSAGIEGINTQIEVDASTGQASLKIDNSGADKALATAAMDGGTASGGLFGLDSINVTTNDSANSALANIETLINTSIDSAAALGSAQGRIETQSSFIGKLSDSLKAGIGTMVDANMEEASTRLQALQVQQQLGVQSLSIANQAPQSILSLFR